ncbi:MAG TPA: hypothetical protein VJO53_07965 [Candidatus Acidoferrales bacterium]|nr:hypothetical protein [Candidatus Acidoferrales bacterium]
MSDRMRIRAIGIGAAVTTLLRLSILTRSSLDLIFGAGARCPSRFRGLSSDAVNSHGTVYRRKTYEGTRVPQFI